MVCDFRFNFAVKHLISAAFINTGDNHKLELSEKGRTVNLKTFDPQKVVRSVIDEADSNNEQNDNVLDKEPWRVELLAALAKMSPKKFELFCRGLLINMGVDLDDNIGINYVGDGGLDGFGYIYIG